MTKKMKWEKYVFMARMSQYFIICIAYTQRECTSLIEFFRHGHELCVGNMDTNVSNCQISSGLGDYFKNTSCIVQKMCQV